MPEITCAACTKKIKDGNIISCSGCNKIYHCKTTCAEISSLDIQSIEAEDTALIFICLKCRNEGGLNSKVYLLLENMSKDIKEMKEKLPNITALNDEYTEVKEKYPSPSLIIHYWRLKKRFNQYFIEGCH